MNNRLKTYLISALSGVLLWLAWPPLHTAWLSFVAFIPLLFAIDKLVAEGGPSAIRVVFASYIAFFLWNLLTTWWVWYASPGGALAAMLLNTLLMTFPVYFYYRLRRSQKRWVSYVGLIAFWCSLEFLHLNWDAPWPWLNLGNVWAGNIAWVQWYEYTGTFGGTIWIWLVNILLYETFIHFEKREDILIIHQPRVSFQKGYVIHLNIALIIIFTPLIISHFIDPYKSVKEYRSNIVAVQPNIDPYNEKFDASTYRDQIRTLISLSEQAIDSNTILVTWPETAIVEDVQEEELLHYASILQVKDFLKRHPGIKLISGMSSYEVYASKKTPTARLFPDNQAWFDMFNSALLLDTSSSIRIYHKSKLVPGVEKMPYPTVFGFLSSVAIKMGGTTGSLGGQERPSVFPVTQKFIAAPVICYESIFGEYVGEYVGQGANIISIITNDGWWKNTPGHTQHLMYAALRAIETRKFISRAANTGTSAFILPSGEIIQPTAWWVPAVIKQDIVTSLHSTFYTRYGDYLGRAGVALSIFFLVWWVVRRGLRLF